MYSSKRTKVINKKQILRTIWLKPGVSRVEISRKLGLDKSTVTNLVSELIELGIIVATDEGEAGPHGGRKPIHLEISEDYGCVVGFELQAEAFTVVVVNLAGEILFTHRRETSFDQSTLAAIFLEVYAEINLKIEQLGYKLIGIGVGVSGIINTVAGEIRFSIPLKITEGFNFTKRIAERLDAPIFIENDANCCAWGEIAFHKSSNLRDFMFVLIEFRTGETQRHSFNGVGIGIGIVIDGKVHCGSDFSVGEFRSAFWNEKSSTQFSITNEELANIKTDRQVRSRFVRELCVNLALFINTLNLKQVFIGGDIEKYDGDIINVLREEMNRNWSYPEPVECDIRFSSVGDKSVAYGAAGMLLDRLFTYRIFPTGDAKVEPVAQVLDPGW